MNQSTKNKISKSLKNYHYDNKMQKMVRRGMTLFGIIMIIFWIIGTPVQAPQNPSAHTSGFPTSGDRATTDISVRDQIVKIAREEGHPEWANYLVKLAHCESRFKPDAINDKGNYPADSYDRGVFQYNSHWQARVSDECAFDIECATKTTIKYISEGNQHLWACDDLVRGVPMEIAMR